MTSQWRTVLVTSFVTCGRALVWIWTFLTPRCHDICFKQTLVWLPIAAMTSQSRRFTSFIRSRIDRAAIVTSSTCTVIYWKCVISYCKNHNISNHDDVTYLLRHSLSDAQEYVNIWYCCWLLICWRNIDGAGSDSNILVRSIWTHFVNICKYHVTGGAVYVWWHQHHFILSKSNW